jgi:hypothetical protein
MLQRLRSHAAAPALLCISLPWLLSGCSVWNNLFHRSHDNRCTEKPFQGNTENLAGLRVPEGMAAPEQRNQVKIPALNEPDHPRARTEPCLTQPPSYSSGAAIAQPTRTGVPMGAPAPTPVPASPTAPQAPESAPIVPPLPPTGAPASP